MLSLRGVRTAGPFNSKYHQRGAPIQFTSVWGSDLDGGSDLDYDGGGGGGGPVCSGLGTVVIAVR